MSTLQTKTVEIEAFMLNCNQLFVGKGQNNEYLLDICAQSGLSCIEEAGDARHVSCCCAYHPFTTFGLDQPQFTIKGSAEIDGSAYPGRRLVTDDTGPVDICAEAWLEAQPLAGKIYNTIDSMGGQAYRLERANQMSEKYGEAFCDFKVDDSEGLPLNPPAPSSPDTDNDGTPEEKTGGDTTGNVGGNIGTVGEANVSFPLFSWAIHFFLALRVASAICCGV